MISLPGGPDSISRRVILALPAAFLLDAGTQHEHVGASAPPGIERDTIASARLDGGLHAPLTLGMARVVLRPGATTWASIPGGMRMISVESGLLGVAVGEPANEPISQADLVVAPDPPGQEHELLLPAGTTMTFGARGIASVRNPGSRSVVLLDAVVFREEPRALARAFTTAGGISFQLLASASAEDAPMGPLMVTLEIVRLAAGAALPEDLNSGLTLMYVEAGAVDLTAQQGQVSSARAAASAPYALPGALQQLVVGDQRGVTAGGVVFLEEGSGVSVSSAGERVAEMLILSVRESF